MTANEEASTDRKEIERAVRSRIYGSEEFKQTFVFTGRSKKPMTESPCSIETLIQVVCAQF